jgi:hypothetical protein
MDTVVIPPTHSQLIGFAAARDERVAIARHLQQAETKNKAQIPPRIKQIRTGRAKDIQKLRVRSAGAELRVGAKAPAT